MGMIPDTLDECKMYGIEIDTISGGGVFSAIGNFFKDHWKAILIGAAIVVGAAVALAGDGFKNKKTATSCRDENSFRILAVNSLLPASMRAFFF